MNRVWDKGKGAVLTLSLAEMAFTLVFALAIVASVSAPQEIEIERLQRENEELRKQKELLEEQKKSNIPEPCDGYWMDIVAVSGNSYCVEGIRMTLQEFTRLYGERQKAIERQGDCKVRIRFYSEPGLSAEDVFSAQRALRSQFYYREESGTRPCSQ